MPSFSRSDVRDKITLRASGSFSDSDFNSIFDDAVKEVIGMVDLRSTIRKSNLSPNLFDDVYTYTLATDVKGMGLVDLKPQITGDRGQDDNWRMTTAEEFDRRKASEDNLVSIKDNDFIRKLLISRPVDDDELLIDTLDSVGDWSAFGDAENLTSDADDYVKGSAAINWDIDSSGGTTAGIVNTALDEFDMSDYLVGSVFAWVDLSDATDVTNFIVRIGNDASNYYYVTVTTDNEGNSFQDGWNLLRFDLTGKTETGTVTDDECDYTALYMTKDSGKTDETDYRFDNIVIKRGEHYDLYYYSKYGWQSSAGVYAEESSNDTDLLNADTEELALFTEYGFYLIEQHLSNPEKSARHYDKFVKALMPTYIQKYPSQRIIETTTYYNV